MNNQKCQQSPEDNISEFHSVDFNAVKGNGAGARGRRSGGGGRLCVPHFRQPDFFPAGSTPQQFSTTLMLLLGESRQRSIRVIMIAWER